MSLVFVVGTGRCGSTLLSRILSRHAEVLSINELWASLDLVQRIPTGQIDGAQLWQTLAEPDPYLDGLVAAGVVSPEMCYPYDTGRFSPATGVPVISHMTLPGFDGDPDALYDRLAAEVPGWPQRRSADQFRALFAVLAEHLGGRVVVERSAASLRLVPWLHTEFPEARFVHLHRHGPDCALSMSRHPGFRVIGMLEHAMRLAGVSSVDELTEQRLEALPADLVRLITPPFDGELFPRYPLPLSLFGERWSASIAEGVAALNALPADLWMAMRYEDMLAAPRAELSRLAAHLGVPAHDAWLDESAALLEPGRAGQAARLTADEYAELERSCAAGMAALAIHT